MKAKIRLFWNQLLAFWSLLTGKIFNEIRLETARLKDCQAGVDQQLEKITNIQSSNYETVRIAVAEFLKNPMVDLPKLRQFAVNSTAIHKSTPLLMAALRVNIPVWVYGDAGSGKTTSARQAAESISLPFRFISVCSMTTKSELFGYMDAGGNYRGTAFREIFEYGGVFLIDEIDNGNQSVLSVLNTALANGYCAFPDGNIKRHKDARFLAAANTIGHGADVRYIGRNAIDATTLDRFVFVCMNIDENLEYALIGGVFNYKGITDIADGGLITIEDWYMFVRKVRNACRELGIECLVTPRATLYGRQLIGVGVGKTHLENMCIWKGIRETDRTKILDFLK